VVQRISNSVIEGKVNDFFVLSMILLHPYQVYMLTSSLDYLILSFKLFNICFIKRFVLIFSRSLNYEILLHITHNVFCYCPLTTSHTEMQSSVRIHKASESI
jgi:hypothetical protein